MPIDFGYDASGRGNNWTANNLSSTPGVNNDSLTDTPTSYGTDTGVGGEVRGNYATMNPINSSSSYNLSNGNLKLVCPSGTFPDDFTHATIQIPTTGKWYWTCTYTEAGGGGGVGVTPGSVQVSYGTLTGTYASFRADGTYAKAAGVTANSTPASASDGDVYTFAFDADNGRLYIAKNATPNISSTAQLTGFTTGIPYNVSFNNTTNTTQQIRDFCFGASAFPYAAPTGYKALCTQNLPTPTIGATSTTQANDYMNVVLYSGNSSTQNITGVGFAPDFTWLKVRNDVQNHRLFDTVRGANKRIMSSSTAAEATTTDELTAFGSDGFTLGANTDVNGTGFTYVAWNWNAGGSTVTNTSGTISSQVRASTTAGFSVVTYTGNGSGGATVGHGLGASPSWIIIKSRSNATNWMVWTDKLTTNYALEGLNTTGAEVSGGSPSKYIRAVSSTTFTIGDDVSVNQSASYTYVAYCFAPVAGYSAFGSFTGNGSNDGVFVYTGFRPEWVMLKSATQAYRWYMLDAARNTYNVMNGRLFANNSNAEATNSDILDFTSNGFKIRTSDAEINGSGQTIIYACFAEFPFKYALAR
jgi:hypothetical protein